MTETFIDIDDTENLIPLIAEGIIVENDVKEEVNRVYREDGDDADHLIYIEGKGINRFEICRDRHINIVDGEIRLSCCRNRYKYIILNIDIEDSCIICKNTCKSDAICVFYESMRDKEK